MRSIFESHVINQFCIGINIIILLSSFVSSESFITREEDEIVCDTPQGKLVGKSVLKSRGGRQFYSFRGIPYAEKPERFQISKPGIPWEGVLDATEYGSQCAQFFGEPAIYSGTEDCLFLNVHTPNMNPDVKLNVMVWIHGGGFQFGAGSDYNPDYFMDEDIVLVTFNYRLGILGFLSTGDDIVPGNNGMKDQVLALQWVKKHISSFGGSPDKITIFGQSAGGAAVNFLLLSKLSKGLFQNAIAMSGSALNPFANQLHVTENFQKLAKKLDCAGNMKQIVGCFKEKSLDSILKAQSSFLEWWYYPMCTWSVVVEPKSNKENFLTDTPCNLMQSGSIHKVPYITGITSDEGVYQTAGILFNEVLKNELNRDFKRYAPIALQYEDAKNKDWISEEVLEFYAKGKPLEKSTWSSYIEMFGDRSINNGVFKSAKMLSKHTNVYPYVFSYLGESSLINNLLQVPGVHGVAHADDLMYLFKEFFGQPFLDVNTEAGKVSVNFIKSLVEFAKTGIAKPWGKEKTWNPINPNESLNLWYNIKAETELEDIDKKVGTNLKLWDNLFPEDDVEVSSLLKKLEAKTEL